MIRKLKGPRARIVLKGIIFIFIVLLSACDSHEKKVEFRKGDHVVLIGNNLCSRMMNFGYFETELQLRYPDSLLFIRNMCDGGDTPGFRPRSGRNDPWAFPGAEKFQDELAHPSGSEGHLATPDEWLTMLKADLVIGFFGYNESFQGPEGLNNFKEELGAFIEHSQAQKYNGKSRPKLVLVSPVAFEDLSDKMDTPDGTQENANLSLYTQGMKEVASNYDIHFVDAFNSSLVWMRGPEDLTIDGSQLSDIGYKRFSVFLANQLFGNKRMDSSGQIKRDMIRDAVLEKNWFWHNDFKIPNGVHVFGRRYNPFGPENYPAEIAKIREMTANRDTAIWKTATGLPFDLVRADTRTTILPEVKTNFNPGDYGRGETKYLNGQEALDKLTVPPGYKIEMFASEQEFEDLANPVQLSFDNKGRLWVATMPTYPHYRPGDPLPNDKLIILEDTDDDGKADKQITFADGLHIPVGFEFAPEGVYVSQGTNLILLTDTDGDDRADKKEIILSGFDDHDTHHVISAFCADPSGALYMGEGVFLHTNVETSYGPVRATNGGFYRYSPQRRQLERTAQLSIPNPWGIAFDEWGQNIFAETSGPDVRWMMPGTIKPIYGVATHKSFNLIEEDQKVRPTSGLEFISSRHFPDEIQGDLLINNTIGFLGMKEHIVEDDGTGFKTRFRQDLVVGTDPNFRPVDMEFAPDGSLYLVDWHNVLIGHMQHNARDPMRDHVHGRIYRITYPSRPLVKPARVYGASIEELLENLKLPEYRTRYRTRRELRGRDQDEVLQKMTIWVNQLQKDDPRYEHHLLEALWVTWGLNKIDRSLLIQLLNAEDFRARAAAVRVLRYGGHQIADQRELLVKAAGDLIGRVRLEAIVAASWLGKDAGVEIVNEAGRHPLDKWIIHAHVTSLAHLNGEEVQVRPESDVQSTVNLEGLDLALYEKGKSIYDREGYCITCHQNNGKGLVASGFPPLAGTQWVLGDEDRLIKLTLNGLFGPMKVLDKDYPGMVPMTPFGGLLNDEEIASVLTYVRNSFGNEASAINAEMVKRVREEITGKKGFYSPEELLELHPMEVIQ